MLERAFTVALIAAAATASDAAGIKETVRLTIAGPGIVQPIEVTDQRLLALSNVFSGAFIGDLAAEPPDASLPTYSITFDIQTGTGVKRAAYLVYFARSRWTNEGFVYLPGRDDVSTGATSAPSSAVSTTAGGIAPPMRGATRSTHDCPDSVLFYTRSRTAAFTARVCGPIPESRDATRRACRGRRDAATARLSSR